LALKRRNTARIPPKSAHRRNVPSCPPQKELITYRSGISFELYRKT